MVRHGANQSIHCHMGRCRTCNWKILMEEIWLMPGCSKLKRPHKNAYNHMVEISGVSNIKCWYPHIWTSIPLPVLVGFIWCRWTTTQTATLRGNGNRMDPMSWLLQRLACCPSQIGSADFSTNKQRLLEISIGCSIWVPKMKVIAQWRLDIQWWKAVHL